MLRGAPASCWTDDGEYPTLADVVGSDATHVGRLRDDPTVPYGLALWVVIDGLRKGGGDERRADRRARAARAGVSGRADRVQRCSTASSSSTTAPTSMAGSSSPRRGRYKESSRPRLRGCSVRRSACRAPGRTDAGVHAAGQVVLLPRRARVSVQVVRRALNALTGADLAFAPWTACGDDFDPRRHAREPPSTCTASGIAASRRRSGAAMPGMCRATSMFAAMQRAAGQLIGEHDFTSFQGRGMRRVACASSGAAQRAVGGWCDCSRTRSKPPPSCATWCATSSARWSRSAWGSDRPIWPRCSPRATAPVPAPRRRRAGSVWSRFATVREPLTA